ncbi:carbohydrate ABC transporter permease [Cohnella suwonensis]|uniref:Carbohydrate ABC transporter permease n=1 Tax=Cohnella suwonensis TaxID=696072 RepID=A0ABW0M187_9BACL
MSAKNWRKLAVEIPFILLSALVILPFYMLFVNSMKSSADAAQMSLGFPKSLHFENFRTVFDEANMGVAFKNSLIITVVAVVALIVFSAFTGYVIQRRSTRITSVIYFVILVGLTVPTFMVPTYVLAKNLHLTDSLTGIILVSIAINFPYGVFLYTGYFKSIPREIDESAVIDGCKPYGLFFRIIFPLLLPVTVTSIIIQFLAIWNDFSTAVYFLNTSSKYSLVMTTFFFFGAHAADWNLVFANLVIISLPVLILYFLLQRLVISGLTSGAVKS